MDKYKKLISNTVIFAIGTFSSKVLVFLLMPLYTRVLTNAEYGVTDLIIQTGNLLLPLVSLGIVNAVLRFGLERTSRKNDVFTTGLLTIMGGFVILLLFWPLLDRLEFISGHTGLIYMFVLMSTLRSLCSQFVRARGQVRLFAVDGILSTVTTILFNLLFLLGLQWGVFGYVLAIVCSDALSVLFLSVNATLWKYVHIRSIRWPTSLAMLKYSVPLIPNTMLWWITNVSDRYIVSYMLGNDANGLYAVAYKVPSIVVLVSGIFMDAWQMSAVTETKGRERFFTKVFRCYCSLLFIVGSGIILFCKVITKLLVSDAFYSSWKYIPFLVLATVFTCIVNFLGSIYMVEKKSMLSLATTTVGAASNVVLNFLLIPQFGVNGAAVATFISYLLVFLIRAWDTRRFVKLRYSGLRLTVNTVLLLLQSIVMIWEAPFWIAIEIFLTALMIAANANEILINIKKLLRR
ncbi:lipopolysaccharide biosynthesis protein [Anaeromassilibacillus senegalensis]|uniref:lipopolysaccharide biosynthesis protein n=1 Tax=Anaeromassilibacillus senegalensis TaxID=1673717 RepID=UPI000682EA13|nr:polysaccharide biosynthesis C-terminal domain-containing protein [Anaeromassilibacillus senegalensis]